MIEEETEDFPEDLRGIFGLDICEEAGLEGRESPVVRSSKNEEGLSVSSNSKYLKLVETHIIITKKIKNVLIRNHFSTHVTFVPKKLLGFSFNPQFIR